ncbi:MAG: endolytic transglycosylase MltG [Acetatifactor sp.]|nr:endolytic transglycosylase MltG [Acetatifactor sp.]
MKTSTLTVVGAVFGAIFRVGVVIFAAYTIYNWAFQAYDYGYRIFTEPAVSAGEGRKITVSVTEDMSPAEIGKLFETKGLVKDGRLFMLQYYLSEFQKDVAPGTFELSTSMTAEEMMEAMAEANKEPEEGE